MSRPRQPSQLTLPELLRRSAFRSPDAPAIGFDSRMLTFRELELRAGRLAGALARLGVRRGDRVGVWLYNGTEIVETLFAVHQLGAVAVPVNFRLSAEETAFILADCQVSGLIADHRLRAELGEAFAPACELSVVAGDDSSTYEQALRAGEPPAELAYVDDDEAAFIIYTSGTTGRPKGAVLTHKNLVVNAGAWIFEVGAGYGDTYLFGYPLFHIGGLVGLYPFVQLGAPAILLPSGGFDAASTLDLIESSGTTIAAFVPAQWQLLLEAADARKNLRRVRRAIWGGAPASRPLLERMVEVLPTETVMSAFGQTEVTANATWLAPADAIRKLGSVGRPALTVEHRIVDENDRDVARGEVGEIVYRGPTVMREYWGRPDANARAFRGGWFHGGDLVREDDDGYVHVVDRKNDMIISGGENVYPAEVERVLCEHPAVQEAAVFGVPDDRWGETPVAYVVPIGSEALSSEELRAFFSGRLARYKHPTHVEIVNDLPRNPSGKVLKRVLREEFTNDQGALDAKAR